MKRIMITLIGALAIAFGSAAQEQADTTQRDRETKQRAETGETDADKQTDMAREPRMQQSDQPESDRYNSGEMVIIRQDDVPESLRTTLQDEKYKGWENAIIYRNTRTGEYLISPRPYRFSREGKPIEYGAMPAREQQRQQGQQRQDESAMEETRARNQQQTDPNRQMDQAQDTARENSDRPVTAREQTDRSDQTDPQQSSAYRTDRKNTEEISTSGMTEVQQDQYPAALRETLKDSQYEGWENGKMYQDPSTNEYVLVIDDNEKTSGAKRYYRFDKDGKEVINDDSGDLKKDDQ